MLIYNKNNKLFGTLGDAPTKYDTEVIYKDINGNILILNTNDLYFDNKHGGVKRKSDNKQVDVYIDNFKVIPQPSMFPTVPKFTKKSKYLNEITIKDVDYEYANWYFTDDTTLKFSLGKRPGQCTSIWKDGKLYRHFDWYYNHDVAFAVHIPELIDDSFVHGYRISSTGVADSVPGLDVNIIKSGQYTNAYKLIPFYVVDGYNDKGVCISMNVVPKQKGDNTGTIPEVEKKHSIQESALPRFVLDNFESAEEAVTYIKNYVSIYPNKALLQSDYDTHYLIGDLTKCFIVELIGNKVISLEVSGNSAIKPIITNFHVIQDGAGNPIVLDNGHVYTPATVQSGKKPSDQFITSHGSGLERYNIAVDNYDNLPNLRQLLNYNNAYTLTEDCWYTEFVGNYKDGLELTVDSTPDDFEGTNKDYKIMSIVRNMYKSRTRDNPNTWHTTHVSYYDPSIKQLSVFDSNEDNIEYTFSF